VKLRRERCRPRRMHCGHSLNSLKRKAAHEWITLLGYTALRKSPLGLAVSVTSVQRLVSPLCRQNSSETKVPAFARRRLLSPIVGQEGIILYWSNSVLQSCTGPRKAGVEGGLGQKLHIRCKGTPPHSFRSYTSTL
jgi:hypothetical protein